MRNQLLVIEALLVAGCATQAPAEVLVVTATPEPATAAPQATSTAEATATPEPTSTPTLEPTPTPDVRVIDMAPRAIVLTKDELPQEGKFYLYDETPHRNSEVVSGWGVEEGARYLDESGRIDGWTKGYARGTTTTRVPEQLDINVILYKAAGGGAYADSVLGVCAEDWTLIDEPEIGDHASLCLWKEMQPRGKNYLIYELNLDLRNVRVQLWAYGFEDSFDLEWLLGVADLQIEKLSGLPVSESVTYAP
jgi:hypothetical protein